MKSVLETCLSEGHYLLLTDCDVNKLMNNRKIETVLRNKTRFINSDKPFKLNLGTQEIECNPKFRFLFFILNSEFQLESKFFVYKGFSCTQLMNRLMCLTILPLTRWSSITRLLKQTSKKSYSTDFWF